MQLLSCTHLSYSNPAVVVRISCAGNTYDAAACNENRTLNPVNQLFVGSVTGVGVVTVVVVVVATQSVQALTTSYVCEQLLQGPHAAFNWTELNDPAIDLLANTLGTEPNQQSAELPRW